MSENLPTSPVLRTERLILRPWRAEDVDHYAALSADPRVMEFFPSLLTRQECEEGFGRVTRHFAQHGFGFWAIELPGVAPFIGFVGLAVPTFESHFTPCVETGWRLAYDHWGKGYATEGARASLAFGFEQLKLSEIVAFAVAGNRRSLAVMERLGMTRNPAEDFDHPKFEPGHRCRRHVLYRLSKSAWAGQTHGVCKGHQL